eukprot:scaffold5561_cov131-Isochrysis_galbana.AAC.3
MQLASPGGPPGSGGRSGKLPEWARRRHLTGGMKERLPLLPAVLKPNLDAARAQVELARELEAECLSGRTKGGREVSTSGGSQRPAHTGAPQEAWPGTHRDLSPAEVLACARFLALTRLAVGGQPGDPSGPSLLTLLFLLAILSVKGVLVCAGRRAALGRAFLGRWHFARRAQCFADRRCRL